MVCDNQGENLARFLHFSGHTRLWPEGVALRDGSLRSALFAARNTLGPKVLQPVVVKLSRLTGEPANLLD